MPLLFQSSEVYKDIVHSRKLSENFDLFSLIMTFEPRVGEVDLSYQICCDTLTFVDTAATLSRLLWQSRDNETSSSTML